MILEAMNSAPYRQEDGTIILYASMKSDFVAGPVTGKAHTSAALLCQRMKRDFALQVETFQRSLSTYDILALMAMESRTRWAKAYSEYVDLHTRAAVFVVTDTTSDDRNEMEIDSDSIWLQLYRKGRTFAIHYSLDGAHRRMHRILRTEMGEELKVGLVTQSPLGDGGDFILERVSLKPERKADIRSGN